ncbi:MAG: GNAT family N-acetyltransferase [Chitinivibrionales bacterium]|nr:GNAT family N-acetyltransferase [Chitinivibrionales bacterium]
MYSIAQAKIEDFWIIKAIYHDEEMVGFIMYMKDYPHKELYICRLMIDAQFQKKVYGKAALDLVRQMAEDDPKI